MKNKIVPSTNARMCGDIFSFYTQIRNHRMGEISQVRFSLLWNGEACGPPLIVRKLYEDSHAWKRYKSYVIEIFSYVWTIINAHISKSWLASFHAPRNLEDIPWEIIIRNPSNTHISNRRAQSGGYSWDFSHVDHH